jgi:hypothetical protein
MANVKEVATKVVIELMAVAQQTAGFTAEDREHFVISKLCRLDDGVVGLCLIPNALEEELVCAGVDKVQEYLCKVNIKAFVKKNYERVKSFLKRLIPGGE